MIEIIDRIDSKYIDMIKDDPVRPEIPIEYRISNRSQVFLWFEGSIVGSVICCSYCDFVPSSVDQLYQPAVKLNHAIFYTVWSYRRGCGREIIFAVRDWIKQRRGINKFLTLSPVGQQVERFHLGNGANIYRINSDSINYSYS